MAGHSERQKGLLPENPGFQFMASYPGHPHPPKWAPYSERWLCLFVCLNPRQELCTSLNRNRAYFSVHPTSILSQAILSNHAPTQISPFAQSDRTPNPSHDALLPYKSFIPADRKQQVQRPPCIGPPHLGQLGRARPHCSAQRNRQHRDPRERKGISGSIGVIPQRVWDSFPRFLAELHPAARGEGLPLLGDA